MPTHEPATAVVERGDLSPPTASEALKARILAILAGGQPDSRWDRKLGEWVADGWRVPPGAHPWWRVRQSVGGKVAGADFVAAVAGLIGEGEVIEVWLAPRGLATPPHVLLLPGWSRSLIRPVVKARGRLDVLEAEPWSAGLAAAAR
jgi:hypothetical protein